MSLVLPEAFWTNIIDAENSGHECISNQIASTTTQLHVVIGGSDIPKSLYIFMELKIVKFFNRLGKGKIDDLTDFLSRVRYLFIFWTAVSAAAIFFGGERRTAIFISLASVTAAHFIISEGIIKHALTRLFGIRHRPYLIDSEIVSVGRQFSDSSFPSSHMASSVAMLWVLVHFFPFVWPAAIFFSLAMAFIRIHNGMHYPSDILAGIILGIAYGALGIYVSKMII